MKRHLYLVELLCDEEIVVVASSEKRALSFLTKKEREYTDTAIKLSDYELAFLPFPESEVRGILESLKEAGADPQDLITRITHNPRLSAPLYEVGADAEDWARLPEGFRAAASFPPA